MSAARQGQAARRVPARGDTAGPCGGVAAMEALRVFGGAKCSGLARAGVRTQPRPPLGSR